MITQYIFMTEEASMEEFLNIFLLRTYPHVNRIIIAHEGKQDLEKSIQRKIGGWRDTAETSFKFIIIRDKDSGHCIEIKEHLLDLSSKAGRNDSVVIIAVHELESWFLGDLAAIEAAYQVKNLSKKQNTRKYRNPDHLANPSLELHKITNHSAKISRARKIAHTMDFNENTSESFNHFLRKMREIIND